MFPYFLTTMAKNWKDGGWGALIQRVDLIRGGDAVSQVREAPFILISKETKLFKDMYAAVQLLKEIDSKFDTLSEMALKTLKDAIDSLRGVTYLAFDKGKLLGVHTNLTSLRNEIRPYIKQITALTEEFLKYADGEKELPLQIVMMLQNILSGTLTPLQNVLASTNGTQQIAYTHESPVSNQQLFPIGPSNNSDFHHIQQYTEQHFPPPVASIPQYGRTVSLPQLLPQMTTESAAKIRKEYEDAAAARRTADTAAAAAKQIADTEAAAAAKRIADTEAAAAQRTADAAAAAEAKLIAVAAAKQITAAETKKQKEEAAAKQTADAAAKQTAAAAKLITAAETKKQKEEAAAKQTADAAAAAKRTADTAAAVKRIAEAAAAKKQKAEAAIKLIATAAADKKKKAEADAAAKKNKEDAAVAAKRTADAAAAKRTADAAAAAAKRTADATAAAAKRPAVPAPVRPATTGRGRK